MEYFDDQLKNLILRQSNAEEEKHYNEEDIFEDIEPTDENVLKAFNIIQPDLHVKVLQSFGYGIHHHLKLSEPITAQFHDSSTLGDVIEYLISFRVEGLDGKRKNSEVDGRILVAGVLENLNAKIPYELIGVVEEERVEQLRAYMQYWIMDKV